MQLSQAPSMRQEMGMRQLLTPRMIQSMEILQLPLMALEERIEQEMQNNPVLELRDGALDGEIVEPPQNGDGDGRREREEGEQALVVKENNDQAEDFDRLSKIAEYFENEE